MKRTILLANLFFVTTFTFAQNDTIFLNNEKILCSVKEITEDAVKFSYPEEELVNSIYKNSVQKIVFKNGRIQTFSESTSFKSIKNVDDYENVSITQVESEIRGLFKIGEVSSKSKGTTTLSNQERVKERAYRKLKIEAAMMGANVVFLTHQRTEGNKAGGYWQSGSSAETNLSGVAYTNKLPDYNDFVSLIGENKEFVTIERAKLWSSSSDLSKSAYKKKFVINNIMNENGIIMIKGNLEGIKKYDSFKVVSYDENTFNIFYEDKSTTYNITVQI